MDIGIVLLEIFVPFLLALWLVKTRSETLKQKKIILLVSYSLLIVNIFVEPLIFRWLNENMSNIHGAALFMLGIYFSVLAFLVSLAIIVMERPEKQYMHATLFLSLVGFVYEWLVNPSLQVTLLVTVLQFAPLVAGVLIKTLNSPRGTREC